MTSRKFESHGNTSKNEWQLVEIDINDTIYAIEVCCSENATNRHDSGSLSKLQFNKEDMPFYEGEL